MTRKQALNKAIQVLSNNGEYAEVVRLLKDIHDELPLIHWSDKSIRDTVEQFIIDNCRIPSATDFKRKGMPPHPVIKLKYKITLGEWLGKNYPKKKDSFDELKEKYTKEFIEEYDRIKPRSQGQYNSERNTGTKCWQTIASYYKVKSWRELMEVLNLPTYSEGKRKKEPVDIKVNVFTNYDFRD